LTQKNDLHMKLNDMVTARQKKYRASSRNQMKASLLPVSERAPFQTPNEIALEGQE
jgi:hypothetical protein